MDSEGLVSLIRSRVRSESKARYTRVEDLSVYVSPYDYDQLRTPSSSSPPHVPLDRLMATVRGSSRVADGDPLVVDEAFDGAAVEAVPNQVFDRVFAPVVHQRFLTDAEGDADRKQAVPQGDAGVPSVVGSHESLSSAFDAVLEVIGVYEVTSFERGFDPSVGVDSDEVDLSPRPLSVGQEHPVRVSIPVSLSCLSDDDEAEMLYERGKRALHDTLHATIRTEVTRPVCVVEREVVDEDQSGVVEVCESLNDGSQFGGDVPFRPFSTRVSRRVVGTDAIGLGRLVLRSVDVSSMVDLDIDAQSRDSSDGYESVDGSGCSHCGR